MRVQHAHGHRHRELRGFAHIPGHFHGPCGVAEGQRLRQFKDTELPADAHVLFYVLRRNGLHALGEVLQEFLRFDGDPCEVGSGRFHQQPRAFRVDLQPPLGVIGHDPFLRLIIAQGQGFHDDALLQDSLVQRLALVGGSPVHQDDQNGGIQRFLAVEGEVLERFHRLRLLHHHQLPLRHHREPPRRGDHRVGIDIGPIADKLIEILFPVLQAVVDDCLAQEVGIIRLLPHQEIHRLEVAGLDLLDETADLPVGFHIRFRCHIRT